MLRGTWQSTSGLLQRQQQTLSWQTRQHSCSNCWVAPTVSSSAKGQAQRLAAMNKWLLTFSRRTSIKCRLIGGFQILSAPLEGPQVTAATPEQQTQTELHMNMMCP